MGNIFVDRGGEVYKFVSENDRPVHVRFPVKLAVKIEEEFPEFFYYSDFVLNLNKGEVFIITDSPIPKGSLLIMHFFIPPEEKLLGEFEGKVTGINHDNNYPKGVFVEFKGSFGNEMIIFTDYLDEKKHLIDIDI